MRRNNSKDYHQVLKCHLKDSAPATEVMTSYCKTSPGKPSWTSSRNSRCGWRWFDFYSDWAVPSWWIPPASQDAVVRSSYWPRWDSSEWSGHETRRGTGMSGCYPAARYYWDPETAQMPPNRWCGFYCPSGSDSTRTSNWGLKILWNWCGRHLFLQKWEFRYLQCNLKLN